MSVIKKIKRKQYNDRRIILLTSNKNINGYISDICIKYSNIIVVTESVKRKDIWGTYLKGDKHVNSKVILYKSTTPIPTEGRILIDQVRVHSGRAPLIHIIKTRKQLVILTKTLDRIFGILDRKLVKIVDTFKNEIYSKYFKFILEVHNNNNTSTKLLDKHIVALEILKDNKKDDNIDNCISTLRGLKPTDNVDSDASSMDEQEIILPVKMNPIKEDDDVNVDTDSVVSFDSKIVEITPGNSSSKNDSVDKHIDDISKYDPKLHPKKRVLTLKTFVEPDSDSIFTSDAFSNLDISSPGETDFPSGNSPMRVTPSDGMLDSFNNNDSIRILTTPPIPEEKCEKSSEIIHLFVNIQVNCSSPSPILLESVKQYYIKYFEKYLKVYSVLDYFTNDNLYIIHTIDVDVNDLPIIYSVFSTIVAHLHENKDVEHVSLIR